MRLRIPLLLAAAGVVAVALVAAGCGGGESKPAADGDTVAAPLTSLRSITLVAKISVTMMAEMTHHMQMAWMTNSSR